MFRPTLLLWLNGILTGIIAALMVAHWLLNRQRQERRRAFLQQVRTGDAEPCIVGFFHPYCNAGGGGERVLWTSIEALLAKYPHVVCALYTGDTGVSKTEMLEKAKLGFGITIPEDRLALIYLKRRVWVEDKRYPRLTLLGQSLGSLVLGWEALTQLVPDVFIDSMGYAFVFPLVVLARDCRLAAYVHYPTISTDMIERVESRAQDYNNASTVAKSSVLSTAKLWYYRLFARVYGWVGSRAEVVMVNSSWTRGHIEKLWGGPARLVYPPCDTTALSQLPLDARQQRILSIGQFRPEKDHALQVRSMKRLLALEPSLAQQAKLVMLGSCRHDEDQARIDALHKLVTELELQDHVEFVVNASYATLLEQAGLATIGLHTMWNEHFGIGVVEYMAAGMVPIAHDSGGPQMDIVVEHEGAPTGYRAHDENSFAEAMRTVLLMSEDERLALQQRARAASMRFSAETFSAGFLAAIAPLLDHE